MTDDELLDRLSVAMAAPHAAPPADRVAQLRREVAAAAQAGDGTAGASVQRAGEEVTRPASARSRWVLAAAAALGAAAVTAVVVLTAVGPLGEPPGTVEYVAVVASPATVDADAEVRLVGEGRVVLLSTEQLPILPTGELYEVWFVGPDDTPSDPQRISAGTFHPDEEGRTDVQLLAAVDPSRYPALVITAEPGDADPAVGGPEVLRFDLSPA